MNLLNETLIELSQFLSKNKIPYMVIGGLANAIWGNPRATIDIDVTILLSLINWTLIILYPEYKSWQTY